MSIVKTRSGATKVKIPPTLSTGALLRLSWQRVRRQMIEALADAGYELDESMFAVFAYPLPDGVRPTDIAQKIGMTRQATNYLIAQLETAGYLERRAPRGSSRRLVHMTKRGWQLTETMFAAMRGLQAQWAQEVGQERFEHFLDVLRMLSSQQPPTPAPRGGRH
jgi:DNA-binding MarR family transcriptional regulator